MTWLKTPNTSPPRQEQERTDARIDQIEHILANVEVIKGGKGKKAVGLGSTVTLKGSKKELTLQVVGTIEADPLASKISDESPIGKALLGKKEGDEVEIKLRPAPTSTASPPLLSSSRVKILGSKRWLRRAFLGII
ncbi:MAG: GreA/GreB family elongation factor [Candidatus Saccharibacteria bacterium]